jgi:tetratricopeptide (TPR) repeat protein
VARKNAYAISVPEGVPSHVKAGLDLLNEGELPSALAVLRGAYEAAPQDAYTCAFLGYLLYMADPVSKIEQALKLLENATRLDPSLPYPFLLLGRVADFKQDRARALRAYEDCLAIDPMENEAEEAIIRLQRFVR